MTRKPEFYKELMLETLQWRLNCNNWRTPFAGKTCLASRKGRKYFLVLKFTDYESFFVVSFINLLVVLDQKILFVFELSCTGRL